MIVDIEVTESDIEQGERQWQDRCPVAISLQRALLQAGIKSPDVRVWRTHIVVLSNSGAFVGPLPPLVRVFTTYFDEESPFAVPFSSRVRLKQR